MILEILKNRYFQNMSRHPELSWETVEKRLLMNQNVLTILEWMEKSGGEPDTIGIYQGRIIYCDCSAETPAGRRSQCYDDAALFARKKNPPKSSAVHEAKEMGVSLLTEELYYRLQELGSFDLKTSSWIAAPAEIRKLGGALFCERRYGRVFTFHNGADSYYSVRGWRGYICL